VPPRPVVGAVAHNAVVPDVPAIRLRPTGVAAIFNDAGEILLTRRADNRLWCLPSGQMEVGESIADTVVREAAEETGLDVVVERPVGVYSRPHPYYEQFGLQVVAFVCVCRVVGGVLRVSDETTEFGYFAPDRLPSDIVSTHVERIRDSVAARGGAAFVVA
jgi:8-oxo-dGTP pyrophosphatase MutT (NUDIX family)